MKVPLINLAIQQTFQLLSFYGSTVEQKTWQSVESPDKTFEIDNIIFKGQMPELKETLAQYTKADLPWAEDHFQERISGEPTNPGEQWKNWPYYKKEQDDERFRRRGKFDHTYMERFWPLAAGRFINKESWGIRFMLGDYDDIIQRAKYDQTSRQLYLSIWHPEDQSNSKGIGKVERRLPCSLGYFFLIRNNKVNLTYHIRSCDILRHFCNDIYLAVRLAQDFRDKVNPELQMGEFTMWIGSLHCWESEKNILLLKAKNLPVFAEEKNEKRTDRT